MLARAAEYVKQSCARAREGHLPLYRQLAEMVVLQLAYSIGPGFYHKARLWRRDLPFRSKTRYRVGRRYLKAVAAINAPAYHKLSQNKVAEKALLKQFSIATADFFGFYHPHSGCCSDGQPLTNEVEFLALLQRRAIVAVAVKMPEGSCGDGFDIIDIEADKREHIFSRAMQRRVPVAEYLALKQREFDDQGLVLEAVIQQHPAMAALNASSVNTLRMWVRQYGTGARVRSAVMRVGPPHSLIDQPGHGGVVVPVDVSTGSLGEPIPAVELTDDHFDCRRLEGFTIPGWQEALELAQGALSVFPKLDFAGMDVAITTDGPLIVELNVQPDPLHAAAVDIPTLDLLQGY